MITSGDFGTAAAMLARIHQRSRNAMQSGRARTDEWVLEFEPGRRRRPDPLTGWSGGAETQEQVRLTFPSAAAAQAYAERHAIDYHLLPTAPAKLKLQSYADNFR